jgi:hypothetical protein
LAVSTAALTIDNAVVSVAPPLSASPSRPGSVVSRSVASSRLQLVSDDRLPPSVVTLPAAKQSSANAWPIPLLATIVLAIVSDVPSFTASPNDWLLAIVECVMVAEAVPARTTAVPPRLPTIVTFSSVNVEPIWVWMADALTVETLL